MIHRKQTIARRRDLIGLLGLSLILLLVAVNPVKAAPTTARFSSTIGPLSILNLPLDTPSITPTQTVVACTYPVVTPNFIHVPYWGGHYTIQVDVGPSCFWYTDPDGGWIQYYCGGSGVGPGTFQCDFHT